MDSELAGANGRVLVLRLPKRLVFAVAAGLLSLALLEVGFRISEALKSARRRPEFYQPSLEALDGMALTVKPGSIVLQHHPHLIYTTKPGQETPFCRVNAQGFRGRDWAKEKTPGGARVIVLGGSTVFGFGAKSDEDVFPRILEKRLAKTSRRPFEVLNAGVIGYDSMQELVLLESELLDYSPDAIVLFDGFNDFYNAGLTPPERSLHQYQFDEIEELLEESLWHRLLSCSALYRVAAAHVNDFAPMGAPASHDRGVFWDRPQGAERYAENVRAMCELGRARGVSVLVVPQPELANRRTQSPMERRTLEEHVPPGYVRFAKECYPRYLAAARDAAERAGATYLDGTTFLDGTQEDAFLVSDTVHLNARGNELVAEALLGPVSRLY
jgi:lysophospholipase L1-like esterase